MKAALNSGKSKFSASDVSNLQGRTAVITRGTDGIGFEVARALALAQARVILLSREGEQGEDAISKIKNAQLKETGPLADVSFIQCDLGNLQHVKKVGDQIGEQEPRLDLLICVAGIGVNKSDVSAEGPRQSPHGEPPRAPPPHPSPAAANPANRDPRRVVDAAHHLCLLIFTCSRAPSSVRLASREEPTRGSDVDSGELDPTGLYARSKLANILFVKYGLVERVLDPCGRPRPYACVTDI